MTLPHISPTPDIIILGVFGLIIVYSILLGRSKIKTLALSAYVGIVLSSEMGTTLYKLLANRGLHFELNLNNFLLLLFMLPLLILSLGRNHGRGDNKGSLLVNLILALLTAALVVSSGLRLLETSTLERLLGESTLATAIYSLRLWWIGVVPLLIISSSFIHKKEH